MSRPARGQADDWESGVHALIIKTSSLGDVVHALPAVLACRAARPDLALDWLVEASYAPILAGHPAIERVITLDTRAPRHRPFSGESWIGLWHSLARLRARRYDAAVDLQRLSKSFFLMRLARADRRYGFSRRACREPLATLGLDVRVDAAYQTDPVREQYLAVLAAVAGRHLTLPPPPHLAAPAAPAVDEFAGRVGGGYVVALAGGGFATKFWPPEHWAELLRGLGPAARVVLPWSGAAERATAEGLAQAAPGAVVTPEWGLTELMALLARARLVLGGDTGPLHLAAALGAPTLSFYGPTLARRNAPPGHAFIQSPVDCAGCVKRSCPKGQPDCMTAIRPAMALEAAREILERPGGRPPDPSF